MTISPQAEAIFSHFQPTCTFLVIESNLKNDARLSICGKCSRNSVSFFWFLARIQRSLLMIGRVACFYEEKYGYPKNK